mmetsp:Transcript_9310/g.20720  ORF Transcript_9310/g.20720 Transcript_9310/m.20720 type:complete len:351 (+) Transcript_9310:43-1095(+)
MGRAGACAVICVGVPPEKGTEPPGGCRSSSRPPLAETLTACQAQRRIATSRSSSVPHGFAPSKLRHTSAGVRRGQVSRPTLVYTPRKACGMPPDKVYTEIFSTGAFPEGSQDIAALGPDGSWKAAILEATTKLTEAREMAQKQTSSSEAFQEARRTLSLLRKLSFPEKSSGAPPLRLVRGAIGTKSEEQLKNSWLRPLPEVPEEPDPATSSTTSSRTTSAEAYLQVKKTLAMLRTTAEAEFRQGEPLGQRPLAREKNRFRASSREPIAPRLRPRPDVRPLDWFSKPTWGEWTAFRQAAHEQDSDASDGMPCRRCFSDPMSANPGAASALNSDALLRLGFDSYEGALVELS